MRRARPAAGFTLIEAIVTMGIFAVLVALGVPSMRTWISNTKVRAVADNLQNGLRLAQSESLRRSRQVVFALTNGTTPGTLPLAATANGTFWAIYTLPSMTDSSETPQFIQSGDMTAASASVVINSNGAAALCFNAAGRLISSTNTALATVIGGTTCTVPTGTPPLQEFDISMPHSDRPLEVQVLLGGQIHMCDPHFVLSSANPEGC